MQVIIDYFKNNSGYTIVFIVALLACVAAIIAIAFIRKKREKAMALEEERKNLANKNEEVKTTSIFDNLPDSFKTSEHTPEIIFHEPANPELESNFSNEQNTSCTFAQEKPANPTVKSDNNQPLKQTGPSQNKSSTNQKQEQTKSTKSEKCNSKVEEDEKIDDVKYAGKWVIYKENDRFVADLKASNGEIMLSSESYTSLSGIKSGIETLKKNIASENYAINLDKNGNYVFKIFSTANRLLCIGEGYSSKDQCEKAFASVKRFAKTAVIVNSLEKENNDK